MTIRDNVAFANGVGILLVGAEDSQLIGNEPYGNEFGMGLLGFSRGNRIESNIATGNGLVDMFHDETSTPNLWRLNTCGTSEGSEIDCP